MSGQRRVIGYTIYSRLEETLRYWVHETLLNQFGDDWYREIPAGVWDKVIERLGIQERSDVKDLIEVLDETDLPDLKDIVCRKHIFPHAIASGSQMKMKELQDYFDALYTIRNKIAHVKRHFSAIDLDLLYEITQNFTTNIGDTIERYLKDDLDNVKKHPAMNLINIPEEFIIYDDETSICIHNLPPADYDPDGGFVGRQEDLKKIEKLVLGNLHRVITISGAGGVGKSAMALYFCEYLLSRNKPAFDAIIWISAKQERLTVTGIEPIQPELRNYEDVLDTVLQTLGWDQEIGSSLENKEEIVEYLLTEYENGILLVIDNLETIDDSRVHEFILDFPPPSKVLVTSRLGLGQVERRYPLKEMASADAIRLLRIVAREKDAANLAYLPQATLQNYIDKISKYPLAIKWVVGQVALGKDVNRVINDLKSPSGDVAKFCFEHIFDYMLSDDAKTALYSLGALDRPLTRGVLLHLSGLTDEKLDDAIRELTIASLIIPMQASDGDENIVTKYEVLPLTKNFLYSKLRENPEMHNTIKSRISVLDDLMEEADRAVRQYRFSLKNMGAETEEEKIAAMWCQTAHQRNQSRDYDGAVEAFQKAIQIAPNFATIYRNWAKMEAEVGFYDRAEELMSKATALVSDDVSLWYIWGDIEKSRGNLKRASEYLRRALSLTEGDTFILSALGEVEKRQGNFAEADQILRQSLEEGPNDLTNKKHRLVVTTSLSDNLRRWAEHLSKREMQQDAMDKLKDSYNLAIEAYEMNRNDIKSLDNFKKVALDYSLMLIKLNKVMEAKNVLDEFIDPDPKRAKDVKFLAHACFYLAEGLLKIGKKEQAKQYYMIGQKHKVFARMTNEYSELNTELMGERLEGILAHVDTDRGFGLIEANGSMYFVHINSILPHISNEDFKVMIGQQLSFVPGKRPKDGQLEAKRVHLIDFST